MNLAVLSWLCRTDLPKKLPWLTDQVPHLIVPGCPALRANEFPCAQDQLAALQRLHASFVGPCRSKKIHVECNLKNEGFGNVSLPWPSSTLSPC